VSRWKASTQIGHGRFARACAALYSLMLYRPGHFDQIHEL